MFLHDLAIHTNILTASPWSILLVVMLTGSKLQPSFESCQNTLAKNVQKAGNPFTHVSFTKAKYVP